MSASVDVALDLVHYVVVVYNFSRRGSGVAGGGLVDSVPVHCTVHLQVANV